MEKFPNLAILNGEFCFHLLQTQFVGIQFYLSCLQDLY